MIYRYRPQPTLIITCDTKQANQKVCLLGKWIDASCNSGLLNSRVPIPDQILSVHGLQVPLPDSSCDLCGDQHSDQSQGTTKALKFQCLIRTYPLRRTHRTTNELILFPQHPLVPFESHDSRESVEGGAPFDQLTQGSESANSLSGSFTNNLPGGRSA